VGRGRVRVAQILYLRGDYPRARLRVERAHELAPRYYGPFFIRSRIDLEGRRAAVLAELERQGEPCVECIVDVQLALGDLDAAVARVERGGFTAGPFYFPKVDPAYAAYRGDPRFRRILQAARLE